MNDCVFCEIVAGRAPAKVLKRWDDAIAIEPLNPVTRGHALVIPTVHVKDFGEEAWTTGVMFMHATEFAAELGPANLITSRGVEATQSVFHLHVHVIPRRINDFITLPWSGGIDH